MKALKPTYLSSLIIQAIALALLTVTWSTQAGNLYWSANGTAQGGTGTWDGAAHWGASAAGPFGTSWNSANNDTGIFGGATATPTITLGGNTTVGGLQFDITGCTIANSTYSLLFGAANNTLTLNNVAAATITGTLGGSGNLTFSAATPTTAGTLTLNGTSIAGWSGTTTINQGLTLALSGSNQGLVSTTGGITLNNGGGITLINTTSPEGALDRMANGAAITSQGGTITYQNTSGNTYSETLGSASLSSGNLDVVENTAMATGSQTLTLSGLSQSGTASATFSAAGTGPQASGNKNMINVTSAGTTTSGQIIGPWATVGTAANAQTDYAVYSSDYIVPANVTASAASGWATTWANNANYTLKNDSGSAANGRLANTVNINSVRNTTTATPITSVNTAAPGYITITGNTYANGDVVVIGGTAPGGLSTGVPYYVVSAGVNGVGTFQLAATSGGSVITITTAGAGNVTAGITLPSGSNLGTYGILHTTAAGMGIGGGGGVITLPTTTSGNLYITPGNAQIQIDAPINDNGAGKLTLVKNGNGALTLRNGSSTYSGGTYVNAGNMIFNTATAFGSGPITLAGGVKLLSANSSALTVANNVTLNGMVQVPLQFTISTANSSDYTLSGTVSGSGGIWVYGTGTARGIVLSGNNTFTGGVILDSSSSANYTKIGLGSYTGLGTGNLIVNMLATAPTFGLYATVPLVGGAGVTNNIIVNSGATLPLFHNAASSPLLLSGVISGAGNVLVANAVTNYLSGVNTFSGTTKVTAGALVGIAGGGCANSDVTVQPTTAGILGVRVDDNTKQWTCKSLTTAGTSPTLAFSFNTAPSASLAPLNITGNLTFTTTPTITMDPANLVSGQTYPVLVVGGTAPTGTIPTVTIGRGLTGTASWSGNTLQVAVAGTSTLPLKWATSTSGTWDINTTANWKDNTSTAQKYLDGVAVGDPVVFDDTFVTADTTVTLNAVVKPTSVTANNSTYNYTISTTGSGAINGSTGLTKSGTKMLTLSTANGYTGATTVSGGILALKNLNAIASSASVSVASGASLQPNVTTGGTYGNSGTVTIAGTGASGTQGALDFHSGGTPVAAWNVPISLASGGATLGSFGTAVNTTLGGAIGGTGPLTISSQGGNGAINTAVWTLGVANNYSGNTVIQNNKGLLDITVKLGVANALPTTTSLNLLPSSNTGSGTQYATLDLNGFNQTLAGLTDTGATTVTAGNVGIGKRVINSSATLATLTINNSGVDTYGTSGTGTGGGLILAGTIGGTLSDGVTAANNLALTKTGAGTLTLAGANTHTGPTTISAGTLALGANNTLPAATAVVLGTATLDAGTFANSVGTLDVTGAGTISLGTGGTLAFADSNTKTWSGGTLNIAVSGSLGATAIRFGTSSSGLTAGQLANITVNGTGTYTLDNNGYLISSAVATPTIAADASVSGGPMTTTYGATSSQTVSFNVSGANMNAGILVTPPAGYVVSLFSGSGYGPTVTVGSSGTIAATPVYVRLSATAPVSGAYNSQNLMLTSSGATTVNVSTGTGNSVSPLPVSLTGSKLYDGNTTINAANLTVGNIVGSDDITVASGTGTLGAANGGLQTLSSLGNLALGGTTAGNYTLSGASGSARINPAPGQFGISTVKNTAATFPASKLVNHASDAGVTLSVTAVAANSSQGGTVVLAAGNITYTPPNNYVGTNQETFTYTLSDNVGGSSTGTVDVAVSEANVSPTITPQDAGGFAAFTASGLAGTNYVVQISTNLPTWTDNYATVQAAINGVIAFTNSVPTSSYMPNGVYFRLRQQ